MTTTTTASTTRLRRAIRWESVNEINVRGYVSGRWIYELTRAFYGRPWMAHELSGLRRGKTITRRAKTLAEAKAAVRAYRLALGL